ncbi:MAG: hypothetical protein AAFN10_09755, partial [Bacteroidota bacterium]
MKKHQLNIFLLSCILLGLLSSSCRDKQQRYLQRLEGKWNLVSETITIINPDGTVNFESEEFDVGELALTNEDGLDYFLQYSLTLNDGTVLAGPNSFQNDEQNKRIIFYNYFCPDILDCDLVATVEENKSGRQVWNWYRPFGSGSHRRVR